MFIIKGILGKSCGIFTAPIVARISATTTISSNGYLKKEEKEAKLMSCANTKSCSRMRAYHKRRKKKHIELSGVSRVFFWSVSTHAPNAAIRCRDTETGNK